MSKFPLYTNLSYADILGIPNRVLTYLASCRGAWSNPALISLKADFPPPRQGGYFVELIHSSGVVIEDNGYDEWETSPYGVELRFTIEGHSKPCGSISLHIGKGIFRSEECAQESVLTLTDIAQVQWMTFGIAFGTDGKGGSITSLQKFAVMEEAVCKLENYLSLSASVDLPMSGFLVMLA